MKYISLLFALGMLLVSCGESEQKIITSSVSKENNTPVIADSIPEERAGVITNPGKEIMAEWKVTKILEDKGVEAAKKELSLFEKKDTVGYYLADAKILFEEKKHEQSLKSLMKAYDLEDGKKNFDVLFMLGLTSDWLGNKEKAKEWTEKSLSIDPKSELAKDFLKLITEELTGQ